MAAIGVVALYVLVTAPLLVLLVKVHGLAGGYTGLFMAALILQLIPIGLFFFPLGFIGAAMLAVSLAGCVRRNRRFQALHIDNPEVERRWRLEYVLHLWAIGFALEQKGVAYLFLDVVGQRGFGFAMSGLLPLSLGLWLTLAALLLRHRRRLPAPLSE
jgi:hypothetical protein